ncbi:MAG: hypothetical protein JWM11_111, partial [Planctomycetaceae bacterium]|nr:hypothetical protein [Planctomycetaceae bacterium]
MGLSFLSVPTSARPEASLGEPRLQV